MVIDLSNENNFFSVSMCVYGGDDPEHFDIALESIVNQTVKPAEIVLVVDCPVSEEINTVIEKNKILCKENDIVFNIYRLKQNRGHGIARRLSFEKCNYEYIALMDADDISVPDRFQKQIEYVKLRPDVSIVGGNIMEFISQHDGRDISKKAGMRIVPEIDVEIKDYMKKRCPMNQMTVLFRKNDISSVGGYQDWYCDEDYYLWIRLAIAGFKFSNINETLVNVRVGEKMYQRRGGIKYFKSEAKLQKYMLDHGLIGFRRYLINVSERFILQVIMPNKIRSMVFKKFARE